MNNKHKTLSIMLALVLVCSNMIFSGHIPVHSNTDTNTCYLCISSGGSNSAINPEPVIFSIIPTNTVFLHAVTKAGHFRLMTHDHLSRAPPEIS